MPNARLLASNVLQRKGENTHPPIGVVQTHCCHHAEPNGCRITTRRHFQHNDTTEKNSVWPVRPKRPGVRNQNLEQPGLHCTQKRGSLAHSDEGSVRNERSPPHCSGRQMNTKPAGPSQSHHECHGFQPETRAVKAIKRTLAHAEVTKHGCVCGETSRGSPLAGVCGPPCVGRPAGWQVI